MSYDSAQWTHGQIRTTNWFSWIPLLCPSTIICYSLCPWKHFLKTKFHLFIVRIVCPSSLSSSKAICLSRVTLRPTYTNLLQLLSCPWSPHSCRNSSILEYYYALVCSMYVSPSPEECRFLDNRHYLSVSL